MTTTWALDPAVRAIYEQRLDTLNERREAEDGGHLEPGDATQVQQLRREVLAAQREQLVPVVKGLSERNLLVSVETYHPSVTSACLEAGADYLVSPCVVAGMGKLANDAGRVVLLGAFTPTEVLAAWHKRRCIENPGELNSHSPTAVLEDLNYAEVHLDRQFLTVIATTRKNGRGSDETMRRVPMWSCAWTRGMGAGRVWGRGRKMLRCRPGFTNAIHKIGNITVIGTISS